MITNAPLEIIRWLLSLIQKFFGLQGKIDKQAQEFDINHIEFNVLKPKTDAEKLKYLIIDNGGKWVESKPFLFGIRDSSNPGVFNDIVGVMHFDRIRNNKRLKYFFCVGTTDPGLPWIKNPINGNFGCAMVCLGVYNDLWILGNRESFRKYVHPKPGKFLVFRQNGSKIRYRIDANKNGVIDEIEPVKEGNIEIQFHPMGFDDDEDREYINTWSAGCCGPKKISDFYKIRDICISYDKSTKSINRFSFALFDKSIAGLPYKIKKCFSKSKFKEGVKK